jgi:hypothetical protein
VNEYYDYLMSEMCDDLHTEWATDSERAHEFCFILSISGEPVQETFFNLYLANLQVEKNTVHNALAFFSGLGALQVSCDCDPDSKIICDINHIEDSEFFSAGRDALAKQDEVWRSIVTRLEVIRSDLQVFQ